MRDHAPGLERVFASPPREGPQRVRIEGDLPPDIAGRLYLNGPARFGSGDRRFDHWLDGDGMVIALAIASGEATLTARYVRTETLEEEESSGKALYRRFGTAWPGDRLLHRVAVASPVNVSVVPFAGTLLALGEQGLPWELDPETLDTRGRWTFSGRLNTVSPLAAHTETCPQTGELVAFGISYSATHPSLTLYRFAPGGELLLRAKSPLLAPISVHDFAISRHYAAFHLGPYVLDMDRLRSGGTVLDALSWQPERGSRLRLLHRADGALAAEVDVGNGYCLHLFNAFESGKDRVTVDLVELDRPVYPAYTPLSRLLDDVPAGRPVRLVLDVASGRLAERRPLAYENAPDFPAVDLRRIGRPYRRGWMLGIGKAPEPGRKFFDELVAVDWTAGAVDRWTAPAGSYLAGEPAFVPGGDGPEEGWLLVPLFDPAHPSTSFLLFAADDVASGPRARLHLQHPLHLAFHACFVPAG